MSLQAYSIYSYSLALETLDNLYNSCTLSWLSHRIVVVIKLCIRVGLLCTLESPVDIFLPHNLIEVAVTVRAIVFDTFVGYIIPLDLSAEMSIDGIDIVTHILLELFLAYQTSILIVTNPTCTLRVPYRSMAYNCKIMLLRILYKLIGQNKIINAFLR